MCEDSLILERFADTPFGVFGTLSLKDGATLYTIERPWLNNKPRISCIPNGEYKCVPKIYRRGGYDAVEITNVDGRTHILFHIGNTLDDSLGCVLIGSGLGYIDGKWAVTGSGKAFKAFMQDYGSSPFNLTIQSKQYRYENETT